MLKSIQHDLLSRFTSARVGQIIDDRVRQTDLVLRDSKGRFIVLCPETDSTKRRFAGEKNRSGNQGKDQPARSLGRCGFS